MSDNCKYCQVNYDLAQRLKQENDQLRKQLQALSDGVNRRCGQDVNQLPLVSLDTLIKRIQGGDR
jgi:hypothetical protein